MNARYFAAVGGIKHHHRRAEFAPGDGRRFAARARHRAVRRSEPAVIAAALADDSEAVIPAKRAVVPDYYGDCYEETWDYYGDC